MPTPVSNSSAPVTTALPETPPIGPAPPPPRVVTIDPVYIEGDAGRQELLRRHAAATATPQCGQETKDAVRGGAWAGGGVVGTLAGAATGGLLGLAAGLIGLFLTSEDEGEKQSSWLAAPACVPCASALSLFARSARPSCKWSTGSEQRWRRNRAR